MSWRFLSPKKRRKAAISKSGNFGQIWSHSALKKSISVCNALTFGHFPVNYCSVLEIIFCFLSKLTTVRCVYLNTVLVP